MAFTQMNQKSDGDPISANDWNAIVGNFAAGVPDLMTTKGDIVAATGANAAARVGVGANGTYLIADSGQDAGMGFATPGRFSAYFHFSVGMDLVEGEWTKLSVEFVERYDTASAFDTTTSTFTAPHAGYYIVIANALGYHSYHAELFTWMLGAYKNGALDCVLTTKYYFTSSSTNEKLHASGSAIVGLEKGDTLELYYYAGGSSGSVYTSGVDINFVIVPII